MVVTFCSNMTNRLFHAYRETFHYESQGAKLTNKLNVNAEEFYPSSLERSRSESSWSRSRNNSFNMLLDDFQKFSLRSPLNQSMNELLCEPVEDEPVKSNGFFKNSENDLEMLFSIFGKSTAFVKQAIKDPEALAVKELITLSDMIINKVQQNQPWVETLASLTMCIIKRKTRTEFAQIHLNKLKYIINTVYNGGNNEPLYYLPFIEYIHAIYFESKQNQGKLRNDYIDWDFIKMTTLELLGNVSFNFFQQKKLDKVSQVEKLIVIISSFANDLEKMSPQKLNNLMDTVRDTWISDRPSTSVRILLMELIELHASGWNLPARTILYYQKYHSRVK